MTFVVMAIAGYAFSDAYFAIANRPWPYEDDDPNGARVERRSGRVIGTD